MNNALILGAFRFFFLTESPVRAADCPAAVHTAGWPAGPPGTIYWPPISFPPTPDTRNESCRHPRFHPVSNCTRTPRRPSPGTGSSSTGETRWPRRPPRPSCKSWMSPIDRPSETRRTAFAISAPPRSYSRMVRCQGCWRWRKWPCCGPWRSYRSSPSRWPTPFGSRNSRDAAGNSRRCRSYWSVGVRRGQGWDWWRDRSGGSCWPTPGPDFHSKRP